MTPEVYLASKQVTLPTPRGCVELVSMKDALEAVRMTRDSIKHHEDPKIFMVEQDETGDLELNEFENAILEILDFTARSVLANFKMPKFRRLQQLSKEWSVNLLNVAKKVIDDKTKVIESDCSMCVNYEGFGQCREFGNNLIEHCKEYIKGEG